MSMKIMEYVFVVVVVVVVVGFFFQFCSCFRFILVQFWCNSSVMKHY